MREADIQRQSDEHGNHTRHTLQRLHCVVFVCTRCGFGDGRDVDDHAEDSDCDDDDTDRGNGDGVGYDDASNNHEKHYDYEVDDDDDDDDGDDDDDDSMLTTMLMVTTMVRAMIYRLCILVKGWHLVL